MHLVAHKMMVYLVILEQGYALNFKYRCGFVG